MSSVWVLRAVFGLALAAYGLCFLAWWRGKPRMAIGWLLAAGLGLRLYAAGDGFLHEWDEGFHALVAKNLIGHPLRPTLYDSPLLPYDYREWTANHVWLHKPPLALSLMALSMAVFGACEWVLRLPSLVLSTAAIYATYRLGFAWKGPHVGLLAAFLQSVNALLIVLAAGWTASDHVDTALISWVGLALASVAGSAGTASFLGLGFLSGCAVLTKWLAGLLPVVVALVWHWRRERALGLLLRGALALAVCAAVVLPWSLYAARVYPAEWSFELGYNARHVSQVLEGQGHSPWFHLARLPRIFGELAYVPLVVFFFRLFRKPREVRTLALALWIVLPYAAFSVAATKMPAYVMVAAPAIFLVEAEFICWLHGRSAASRPRRIALAVLAALILAMPVRIVLNDLRVFRPHERRPSWADGLRRLGPRLSGSRAVIFGSAHPIEAMFYTSQTAYAVVPDRATVESLQARGYRVLIYDSPELPADRHGWPGVEYLDMRLGN